MKYTVDTKRLFQELDCDYNYVLTHAGVYRPKQVTCPHSRLVTVGVPGKLTTIFVGAGRVEPHAPALWENRTFVIASEEITVKFSN